MRVGGFAVTLRRGQTSVQIHLLSALSLRLLLVLIEKRVRFLSFTINLFICNKTRLCKRLDQSVAEFEIQHSMVPIQIGMVGAARLFVYANKLQKLSLHFNELN